VKITSSTRFPYPILSQDTEDYVGSKFEITLDVEENTLTNSLKVIPHILIEQDGIKQQVTAGTIGVFANVHCRDTYYSDVKELTDGVEIIFEPGVLSGRVNVRALLIARKNFSMPKPSNLVDEFDLKTLNFVSGRVYGVAPTISIDCGRKKLAPVDSIFSIAKSDDLKENQIAVDASNEKIQVLASPETFNHIHHMRNQVSGRSIIFNSVYLPALMSVLHDLSVDPSCYSNTQWFEVFDAKCNFLNIKLENCEPLTVAQQLLKFPYQKLRVGYLDE